MSVLEAIIAFLKTAGQPTEADTNRDGAFSYKSETHAAGLGIAAGFASTAHGDTRLLGVVYAAAVYGKSQEANGQRRRLWQDVRKEPHYAVGGVVTGSILGVLTGWATPHIPLS